MPKTNNCTGNDCMGCIDRGRCEFENAPKCPCNICLVKMMCYKDVCDEFKQFVAELFPQRFGGYKNERL